MLGVCYYPEHWPEAIWADDARRMRALGLSTVRIGEFAWSRLEPQPGHYDFAWFDRAIQTLGAAGLKVVIGTPTATPPKWIIDRHPEILAVDPHTGHVRGFGSRRHYDFSSEVYRHEAVWITTALAERYGQNPHVIGWQTDNELCCHETTLSGSMAARDAFRRWCAARYGTIDALNTAWGNVFWSMEYRDFDEIDLPILAVTETNPAHRLAWRRFSSDQVIAWHQAMVDAIRAHAKGQWITHNFIPIAQTGIDAHALAKSLDFASFDNYPLGFTDQLLAQAPADQLRPFMRTGLPDLTGLMLDQTRGLSAAPFWLMEQQPGPVNWAPHNPIPAAGMVRLWTLQAFAHGAACVSYFRWRQVPFAQEQMHAGLIRPDSEPAEAWGEIALLSSDLAALGALDMPRQQAKVALIVDVEARYTVDIQRQGAGFDYDRQVLRFYSALRGLGIDVDCVPPGTNLAGYELVVAPMLAMPDAAALSALEASTALLVFGPRSGAKTSEFSLPDGLAPGLLRGLVRVQVRAVETLRPDCHEPLIAGGTAFECGIWREALDLLDGAEPLANYENGEPAIVRAGRAIYLGCVTDDVYLRHLLADLAVERGLAVSDLPRTLRTARRGAFTFAFNYAAQAAPAPAPDDAAFVIGGATIPPYGVSVWRAS
ncbi:MAG: beta-galactosidase [Sphingomonas sp.]